MNILQKIIGIIITAPEFCSGSMVASLNDFSGSDLILKYDEIIDLQFKKWYSRNYSTVSTVASNDENYLNNIVIGTKTKNLIKGDNLNNDFINEIKMAETIDIALDGRPNCPDALPLLFGTIKTLRVLHLKNVCIPGVLGFTPEIKNLEEFEMHSCIIEDLTTLIPVGSNLKVLKISNSIIRNGYINKDKVPKLTTLVLNNTNLSMINKDIFMIPTLKKIDLKHNHLSSFPDFDASDVLTVEELDLRKNIFRKIPKSLNNFKKLKKIDMSYNLIDSFESGFTFGEDLAIEELELSYNRIKDIPGSIDNLKKVKKISFMRNAIAKIPSSIFKLENLKNLNLSMNSIKDIEPSISDFETGIFAVTNILSGRIPFSLEEIDLSYNFLKSLPLSFSMFIELVKLNLAGNEFSEIPSTLFTLPKLEILNFGYNKLTRIHPGIRKMRILQLLDLTGGPYFRSVNGPTNQITYVPYSLINRPSEFIIKIILKDNPLVPVSTNFGIGMDRVSEYQDWIVV